MPPRSINLSYCRSGSLISRVILPTPYNQWVVVAHDLGVLDYVVASIAERLGRRIYQVNDFCHVTDPHSPHAIYYRRSLNTNDVPNLYRFIIANYLDDQDMPLPSKSILIVGVLFGEAVNIGLNMPVNMVELGERTESISANDFADTCRMSLSTIVEDCRLAEINTDLSNIWKTRIDIDEQGRRLLFSVGNEYMTIHTGSKDLNDTLDCWIETGGKTINFFGSSFLSDCFSIECNIIHPSYSFLTRPPLRQQIQVLGKILENQRAFLESPDKLRSILARN